MTGFRVAYGGAQALFGIEPDLTTLGKIIGGGLPVGAYGGRADIMDHVLPAGKVFQAGTLERQSAGHGRRHRHAQSAPRHESRIRRWSDFGPAGGGPGSGGPCGRRPASTLGRCRLDDDAFFSDRAGDRLGHGRPLRHEALRPLFLGHDRPRHLSAVQPVRGVVRLDGPHREPTSTRQLLPHAMY